MRNSCNSFAIIRFQFSQLRFQFMTQTLSSLRLVLSIGLIGTFCTTVRADDLIYPVTGANIFGSIQEITKDKVVINARNGPQNVAVNDILRLHFEGEPTQLKRTKELVANGQFVEALAEIKKIDASSLKSDDVKKEQEYYRGLIEARLALIGKGDPTKAFAALKKYVSVNKNSHHLYEAAEMMGEMATLLGEKASPYFSALTKAPFPDYVAKGKYLEGRALLSQGNPTEARKLCAEVAAMQASKPVLRLQHLAKVVEVRCDIAEGKTTEAIAIINQLIQDNDSQDSELFARIKNAEGECYLKMNNLGFAKLAYLTTDGLFSNQPESHAEALYNLVRIWSKQGNVQQAAEAKEKLNSMYSGSIWAKKASSSE